MTPLNMARLRTTRRTAFCWELSTCAVRTSSAVRPNFVRAPVAVTSATASPRRTSAPAYVCRPGPASMGIDSPVSMDWSSRIWPWIRRTSAATGLVEGDILMVMQHIANGNTDLFWRQFFRRHLVEQRLEGVVVVLVDERDPDVGIAQFFQRADSAETDAKDDHMGGVSHSFSTLPQMTWHRRAIPGKRRFSGLHCLTWKRAEPNI